ncbi:MAG: hypothetical protein JWO05_3544 [Gemmatimonadetes bacterium]|nr:hypothetical protein [Gemmatimonadota bacterium]
MDNYYDAKRGDWVTDQSRYEEVLQEPRFHPIRDREAWHWPPLRAWSLLLELLQAIPEDTVHFVGSGLLEDLIHSHSAVLVDLIEREAVGNARFQSALMEVNLAKGMLTSALEERIMRAAGPQFRLLKPLSTQ